VLLAVPRSEGAIEMGEIWNQHIKRKIEKKKKKKGGRNETHYLNWKLIWLGVEDEQRLKEEERKWGVW